MIWKSLAAVVAAIVLVIGINFIGNMVFDAGTPAVEDVDVRGEPLAETPTVTTADVSDEAEAPTVDVEPEVQPTPQTTLGTEGSGTPDQPVTQIEPAMPTEEGQDSQEQAQEQAREGQPDTTAPEPAADETPVADQEDAVAAVAGDPAAGKTAARVCAACHTFDQGGPHRVGPNLFGVVGADIAAKEGYKYSPALQKAEGDWTVETLDAYLADPKAAIPGNKMTYAGLRDDAKRQDVIAYLQSLQ